MSDYLRDITIRNFRSYPESSFEFEDGVNIVVGPNAVGKTNLLEAVHTVCFGKGIRTSDVKMVRHNEDWFRLEANIGNQTRVVTLEKDKFTGRGKKKIIVNDKLIPRMNYEYVVPVVLFQPDDLRFTSSSPERRREYLDKLLIQTVPTYKTDLLAYERALRQRNSALKNGINSTSQLFAWNLMLADKGTKIVNERIRIIEKINEKLSSVYSSVAGNNYNLSVNYKSALGYENYSEKLLNMLERATGLDAQRGSTSVGPHRDDLAVNLNSNNMKDTASRGENRTLILALKIIELDILEEIHNKKPILLLDDVFSELDGLRRKMLTKHLSSRQTILTTTDADIIQKTVIAQNVITF